MRLWTIGILLFVGISCASARGDNYGIKRFHIQSRQLDGKPQCVEIRRKRSTREADYIEQIDIQPSLRDQNDNSAKQKSNVNEDRARDSDDLAEIIINQSDVAGSSAILIVPNPSAPKKPLVFAVRPVLENSNNNKYVQFQIVDDSNISDDDGDVDDISESLRDLSDEVNDDDEEFKDYSEDYKEIEPPRWKIKINTQSKPKQLENSEIAEPDTGSIEYTVKQKKQSNRRMRIDMRTKVLRELLSQNRKNYFKAVDNLRNINKNNQEIYLARSDCIIIEKEPELLVSTNEKSAGTLLGRESGAREPNNRYGLRKRYKGKRA